jgi:protocatechuate 3,4-dioxygenase beta subunit
VLVSASLTVSRAQTAKPAPGKPDRQTAVVRGVVVDAGTGRPIDGAVVSLVMEPRFTISFMPVERPRVSVMTRSDGRFTFRNVRAGSHHVEAARPGYVAGAHGQRRPSGSSRAVDVEPAEDVSISVALWRFAAITGTILDETGEPVVGQEVRALRRVFAGGRYHLRSSGEAWTDDRGVYRIGALNPGSYLVIPHITQRAFVASVTDSSAAPEGTAIVRLGSVLHVIDVDSAVPPVQPGSDRFWIYPMLFYPEAPSAAEATPVVAGSGQERANVDFRFVPVPAARVSGRVFEGLPGAYVTLRLFQAGAGVASDAVVAETYSDASGFYMFPAVPSGAYVLKALSTTAEDNRWGAIAFSVAQRDIGDLDVVLRSGLRVSGRIEAYGGATFMARDVHVAVVPADGSVLDVGPAAVMPNGRFTIGRLPAGDYVLRIGRVPPGWMVRSITHEGRDAIDAPLRLSADAEVIVTVTNRVAEVHGTVRGPTGAPDLDAAVVLFPADRDGWIDRDSLRVRTVRTDRNGEFTIAGPPPGDYRIVAVPAEELDDGDPTTFSALAREAEAFTIDEGGKKEVALQTRTRTRR